MSSYLDDLGRVRRSLSEAQPIEIELAAVEHNAGKAWLPTPDSPQEKAFLCEADARVPAVRPL
jgi:hypothetical protein